MQSETIWLVLPLPNRILSPNVRKHTKRLQYMFRSAARKAKQAVVDAVQLQQITSIPWQSCNVEVYLYHRAKRKRDEDNAVAMLKSTYDGIVEAGVVADDNKQCMQRDWPVMRIDKQAPRMEIVITKQEMQDEG